MKTIEILSAYLIGASLAFFIIILYMVYKDWAIRKFKLLLASLVLIFSKDKLIRKIGWSIFKMVFTGDK